QTSYLLDEEQKTAMKMPFMRQVRLAAPVTDELKIGNAAGAPPPPPPPPPPDANAYFHTTVLTRDTTVVVPDGVGSAGGGPVTSRAGRGIVAPRVGTLSVARAGDAPMLPPTEQHDLGKQIIEGVEAVGTQTVTTIPAGAIGNEQPIRIVSERWYAEA